MFDQEDPRQLSFFPELDERTSLPSISTEPEFDRALGNLIKMSDMGAFIQLNILGLEKSYTINVKELDIPQDFLKIDSAYSALTVHLFPSELRNQLKKLTYDIKAFFTHGNSFKTSFGYFLYRSSFSAWKIFLENQKLEINKAVNGYLSGGNFGHHFLDHFKKGYDHIFSQSDIIAPWQVKDQLYLKDIDAFRKNILTSGITQHNLKPTEIDFPFQIMVVKTSHIPTILSQFLSQIQIHSVFKSIHLEYLSSIDINTIDDIKKLAEGI
ncbi:MAG: hypothetical protein V3S22_03080 [Candidatus Neomarinimicrobiota bacterium]